MYAKIHTMAFSHCVREVFNSLQTRYRYFRYLFDDALKRAVTQMEINNVYMSIGRRGANRFSRPECNWSSRLGMITLSEKHSKFLTSLI